jgi:competence protein ComEC
MTSENRPAPTVPATSADCARRSERPLGLLRWWAAGVWLLTAGMALLTGAAPIAWADADDGRLDIYFIDVEGGAATLLVTPRGETILIDSGYPDFAGRDRDRIAHVLKEVVKLDRLDHAIVSHWHLDHYGNHASLVDQIRVGHFWDRGIPDSLAEDKGYAERIAQYRAATQNRSLALGPGDVLPLLTATPTLKMTCVTGSGDVIPNTGPPNPFADRHQPQDDDPSDNAQSLSFLLEFGGFRFLTCGDLTWNTEAKLMTPNNPLGTVDLFMVTHHGLPVSNNPVLVLAIDPQVAVICNGPTKGCHPQTLATLREVKSLKAWYQLHRNTQIPALEQAPAERIANVEDTNACQGRWIKASVAADGQAFTVQVGADGRVDEYTVRTP